DVGQAFAPGQVYVALSRLRSLEGLTLRTRIHTEGINSDREVVDYTQNAKSQEPLETLLKVHQKKYVKRLLVHTFDFKELLEGTHSFSKQFDSNMEFEDPEMQLAIQKIYADFLQENENTHKYQRQLTGLLELNLQEALLDRLGKGSWHYSSFLKACLKKLMVHAAEVEQFSRTKSYREGLSELELLLIKKLGEVEKVTFLIPSILKGGDLGMMKKLDENLVKFRINLWDEAKKAAKENPKFASTKTGRKRKEKGQPSLKLGKGETYQITYSLSQEGK